MEKKFLKILCATVCVICGLVFITSVVILALDLSRSWNRICGLAIIMSMAFAAVAFSIYHPTEETSQNLPADQIITEDRSEFHIF